MQSPASSHGCSKHSEWRVERRSAQANNDGAGAEARQPPPDTEERGPDGEGSVNRLK